VYSRYFTSIKTMPHKKMQEYVNVNYRWVMSIVGVVEAAGTEKIIAEARYARTKQDAFADVAFIVDEDYQNMGIASYIFELLIRAAREEGIKGFTADVLASNKSMLKVFEKAPFPVQTVLSRGVYELTIPFVDA
ncbi:MAG TPA: GNAT family N-acetyltransferase, partial [Smithella sp.]|nr:GNAT family N-acetyltransferase [Smithella sp.]HOG83025.1 GNAT family N-acetyltransferase [Smithellaceae bacterium]